MGARGSLCCCQRVVVEMEVKKVGRSKKYWPAGFGWAAFILLACGPLEFELELEFEFGLDFGRQAEIEIEISKWSFWSHALAREWPKLSAQCSVLIAQWGKWRKRVCRDWPLVGGIDIDRAASVQWKMSGSISMIVGRRWRSVGGLLECRAQTGASLQDLETAAHSLPHTVCCTDSLQN